MRCHCNNFGSLDLEVHPSPPSTYHHKHHLLFTYRPHQRCSFFDDRRDPDQIADSILYHRQNFDVQVDLPSVAEDAGAEVGDQRRHPPLYNNLNPLRKHKVRRFYVDLPHDIAGNNTSHPILLLIHGAESSADDMKTLFGIKSQDRAKREGLVT